MIKPRQSQNRISGFSTEWLNRANHKTELVVLVQND
jgi:hypothetical protein